VVYTGTPALSILSECDGTEVPQSNAEAVPHQRHRRRAAQGYGVAQRGLEVRAVVKSGVTLGHLRSVLDPAADQADARARLDRALPRVLQLLLFDCRGGAVVPSRFRSN
jgi:hypothetical protein